MLKLRKITIVNHNWVTGAAQELLNYLRKDDREILSIEHSLTEYSKLNYSQIKKFRGKKLILKKKYKYLFKTNLLIFINQFFLNLYLLSKYSRKSQLVVSTNCFNSFVVVILKKLIGIERNIFYCIDYIPNRFNNFFLNHIYNFFDYISTRYSNICWNLTSRMTNAKIKKYNIINKSKFITVPIGINYITKNKFFFNKKKIILIYFGTIKKENGLELILNSHYKYFNNSKFETWIIGEGPYKREIQIQKKINKLKNLKIFGKLSSKKINHLFLKNNLIGLAPYLKAEQAYYADVTKPKFYISYGIPVLITKIPFISKIIKEKKLGILISNTPKSLYLAVKKVSKSMRRNNKYQQNIYMFGQENFLWEKIFSRALKKVIKN